MLPPPNPYKRPPLSPLWFNRPPRCQTRSSSRAPIISVHHRLSPTKTTQMKSASAMTTTTMGVHCPSLMEINAIVLSWAMMTKRMWTTGYDRVHFLFFVMACHLPPAMMTRMRLGTTTTATRVLCPPLMELNAMKLIWAKKTSKTSMSFNNRFLFFKFFQLVFIALIVGFRLVVDPILFDDTWKNSIATWPLKTSQSCMQRWSLQGMGYYNRFATSQQRYARNWRYAWSVLFAIVPTDNNSIFTSIFVAPMVVVRQCSDPHGLCENGMWAIRWDAELLCFYFWLNQQHCGAAIIRNDYVNNLQVHSWWRGCRHVHLDFHAIGAVRCRFRDNCVSQYRSVWHTAGSSWTVFANSFGNGWDMAY